MIQFSHKFRERTFLESAESVLAAILVLCLLAAIFAFLHYNPEVRSAIAEAIRPSDSFIEAVESDPFAVLGVASLPIVVFVAIMLFLSTTWFISKKFIHSLIEQFFISDNCSAELDKGH
jgi:hypothetical protein